MMKHKYLAYLLLGMLAGCSSPDSHEAVRDNVFDAQIKAVDKAKAIEQQVLDAAARQRQKIKEQGG